MVRYKELHEGVAEALVQILALERRVPVNHTGATSAGAIGCSFNKLSTIALDQGLSLI